MTTSSGPPIHQLKTIKSFETRLGDVYARTLDEAAARLRALALFDADHYMRLNDLTAKSLSAAGVDAYSHYIQSGAFEGRGEIDRDRLLRLLAGTAAQQSPPLKKKLVKASAVGITLAVYTSTKSSGPTAETAADFAADLRATGADVRLLDENCSIEDRPPTSIFVAPQEFFLHGAGNNWIRPEVLQSAFMMVTEQPDTHAFTLALPFMLLSRGAFVTCASTARLVEQTGLPLVQVWPGCGLGASKLDGEVRQHPLFRVLPEAAQQVDFDLLFSDRSLDVAFFGSSSVRRDAFFARNAAFFARYETFNYCRRAAERPLLLRNAEIEYLQLARHAAQHAKITLNIHRQELGFFAWHRIVRTAICAGSLVVSEPCLPDPNFIAGQHYFEESIRLIPDLVEWLLEDEQGRQEADRVRHNATALLAGLFTPADVADRLLAFIATNKGGDREEQ